MSVNEPPVGPADGVPPPATRPGPGAGDIIGRVVFGGFWSLVTLGAILAGFAGFRVDRPASDSVDFCSPCCPGCTPVMSCAAAGSESCSGRNVEETSFMHDNVSVTCR
jgi:hypothetical protein